VSWGVTLRFIIYFIVDKRDVPLRKSRYVQTLWAMSIMCCFTGSLLHSGTFWNVKSYPYYMMLKIRF